MLFDISDKASYAFNMSKRYYEIDEIRSRLFIHYFLYGKVRYSKKEQTYTDTGKLGAHLSLVRLYYRLSKNQHRISRAELTDMLNHLQKNVGENLIVGESIRVYIQVIEEDLYIVEST